MWLYKTYGIPDELFARNEDIPITKEEVRAITISKARLGEGYTVIDIGSGSGSITVEAGLMIGSKGKVYAIDKDKHAIELTKENVERFKLSNVHLIHDYAENVLSNLPEADAIFIGGTAGNTSNIVREAYNRLKHGRRMVINAIMLETIYNSINTLQALGIKDIEVTQVMISKGKSISTGIMLIARNPVTIITAER